jgi:NadR type nicotinamide-nucleotide adenylyltransferase
VDEGSARVLTVCFHGAESTGKSVMAARLQARFGWPVVPEYGREYCEKHGTDLTMDDLLAIAAGHVAATEAAARARPDVLLLDTDPLMTAAWAQMLFGDVPERLLTYPKADLYLLFEADVPWVADGTRFFGDNARRARFAALSEAVLVRAGVCWERVGGSWAEREARIVSAVQQALLPAR